MSGTVVVTAIGCRQRQRRHTQANQSGQSMQLMRKHMNRRHRDGPVTAAAHTVRGERRYCSIVAGCWVPISLAHIRPRGIPAPQGGGVHGQRPSPAAPLFGRLRQPPACADCGRPKTCDGKAEKDPMLWYERRVTPQIFCAKRFCFLRRKRKKCVEDGRSPARPPSRPGRFALFEYRYKCADNTRSGIWPFHLQ